MVFVMLGKQSKKEGASIKTIGIARGEKIDAADSSFAKADKALAKAIVFNLAKLSESVIS